jgi:hypothetical protein
MKILRAINTSLSLSISRALWTFPLLQFLNPIHTRQDFLQHKHRKNSTHRHPCFEFDSNPWPQSSSGWRRFMPQIARLLWLAHILKYLACKPTYSYSRWMLTFTDIACILVSLLFSVTLMDLRFSPWYCLIYVNVFCSDMGSMHGLSVAVLQLPNCIYVYICVHA